MMRTILFAASLLILGLPVMARAQAAPARPAPVSTTAAPPAVSVMPAKIAVVDTSAFADEAKGVKRYVNAVKSLQREFQPKQTELQNIQARIKTLSDEITKLRGAAVVDPASLQGKQDEIERLQRDLKYKREQADSDFAKRYEVVVGPVSTHIGKALDQFATQHGITMILDVSKLLPAILTLNRATDLTQAFIADYNSKNP
jgi:Skp family chaperone for outer membrane proteins